MKLVELCPLNMFYYADERNESIDYIIYSIIYIIFIVFENIETNLLLITYESLFSTSRSVR